jgi:hypothetical protein
MSQIIGDIKVADTLDQQPKTIASNESVDIKIVDRVKDGKGTPAETTNVCLNTPAKSQRTIMDVKSEIEAKRKVHQELKAKAQERQTKQDTDMKHPEGTKGESKSTQKFDTEETKKPKPNIRGDKVSVLTPKAKVDAKPTQGNIPTAGTKHHSMTDEQF